MAKNEKPQTLLEKRRARSQNRGNGAIADWESCNSQDVLRLIGIVTSNKGTITFGYTKDGGAYYMSYYLDGESEKVYIRPTEDVDLSIQREIEAFSEL